MTDKGNESGTDHMTMGKEYHWSSVFDLSVEVCINLVQNLRSVPVKRRKQPIMHCLKAMQNLERPLDTGTSQYLPFFLNLR